MKKISLYLLGLLIVVILGLPVLLEKILAENVPSKNEEYSYKTFQIDKDQWGYSILHFDKQFIRQSSIPAIGGKLSFKTETDAGNTAKLVIEKLNRKEMPSVTKSELKELGIIP
jgi:hypothetical protein